MLNSSASAGQLPPTKPIYTNIVDEETQDVEELQTHIPRRYLVEETPKKTPC
jgi:hypothetical protein